MARFLAALDHVADTLRTQAMDPVDAEHALTPSRRDEAAQVEPCVERFTYGELDPTRELAASRNFFRAARRRSPRS